jgi:hypothetical protein
LGGWVSISFSFLPSDVAVLVYFIFSFIIIIIIIIKIAWLRFILLQFIDFVLFSSLFLQPDYLAFNGAILWVRVISASNLVAPMLGSRNAFCTLKMMNDSNELQWRDNSRQRTKIVGGVC